MVVESCREKKLITKCCCFSFSLMIELQGKPKLISVKLASEYTYTRANQSPIAVEMITTEWGSQISDAFYGMLSGQSGNQEGLAYSAVGNHISGNTALYWSESRKADTPFTIHEYLFRWVSYFVNEYRKEYYINFQKKKKSARKYIHGAFPFSL